MENFVADPSWLTTKLASSRGPSGGYGRGPGRPWGGIVEKTPAIWITWVADLCRRAEIDPLKLHLKWGGVPLAMAWVDLTFGRRYYWRCPRCGRRCEAVYNIGGRVACTKCLRLGYMSQARRPGSAFAVLDLIFSRRWPGMTSGRYYPSDEAGELVKEIGRVIRARVEAALADLTIEPSEVGDNGKGTERENAPRAGLGPAWRPSGKGSPDNSGAA